MLVDALRALYNSPGGTGSPGGKTRGGVGFGGCREKLGDGGNTVVYLQNVCIQSSPDHEENLLSDGAAPSLRRKALRLRGWLTGFQAAGNLREGVHRIPCVCQKDYVNKINGVPHTILGRQVATFPRSVEDGDLEVHNVETRTRTTTRATGEEMVSQAPVSPCRPGRPLRETRSPVVS